ncbi:hypothetical protein [Herbaspirillum sp. YR522]|uniref:hypothetical protein n=1 Tax=Herbaspirillum sp. YR522 TaxID=1144342 RepID=UPI0012F85EC0|nr:hypothetical protein [Herbaspirillum sp. YR522]
MSQTPPDHVLREVAQGSPSRASLEAYEMQRQDSPPLAHMPESEVDAKLGEILQQYLATEKNRVIERPKVLAFVKEQLRQLERPEKERDWSHARTLYLDIFGVDEAAMKKIEGGRFSGGWTGSGSLYALGPQLMTLASALPALYLMTVPKEKIKDDPVHYAEVALGSQVAIALATPFINTATQIVSVTRQELMRAGGQSARSAEMKAPGYPKTDAAIVKLIDDMEKINTTMEGHEAALKNLKPGSNEWNELRQKIDQDGNTALALIAKMAEEDKKFNVRKDVIGLNYAGQFRASITRALRTAVNMSASLGANAAHDGHIGNYIQVGGTLATMAMQQFWAGPGDQFSKQNNTLMATIATTHLLDPLSHGKAIDQLTEADLGDLADLPKQWKGGGISISAALDQFKESLVLERSYAEQHLADLVKMDVTDFRRMEEQQAQQQGQAPLHAFLRQLSPADGDSYEDLIAARDRLNAVKHDIACIDNDNWKAMSVDNKKFLLDAVGNEKPWLLSLRTAWVRMQVPADIISQVAQRFGSQFSMLIAGPTMSLIVPSLFRYLNAKQAAAGEPPLISDTSRYVTSVLLAGIGVLGAFSAGPAVNKKITQRTTLRNAIPRVGFQPRETARALGAIGRAMFALPSSAWERLSIQNHASTGRNKAESLRQEVDKISRYLEENAETIGQEVERTALQELQDEMVISQIGDSSGHA